MSGALAGIRVVELAGLGPAPFAAMVLAELGADVVRVTRPGGERGLASLPTLNRSRASIEIDLKASEGHAAMGRLIDLADVLIEPLRPGAMERLGLGPDDCLARNPRLVYGRMTGWGQDGPWADRAGHDITYAAITGALHLCGPAEKPMPPVNVLADFGGGSMPLVTGILAALIARERTGKGQVVDAAMVDGAASLVTMIYGMVGAGLWKDERRANLIDGAAPFYDTYRCGDGGWVAVGPLEPQFYAQFLDGLGLELDGDQYDPSRWETNRAAITEAFLGRTRDEWVAVFEGTDACVAPVLSLAEAPNHPHLAARGTFTTVNGVVQPRIAPRLSGTPSLDPTPPRRSTVDAVLAAWADRPAR